MELVFDMNIKETDLDCLKLQKQLKNINKDVVEMEYVPETRVWTLRNEEKNWKKKIQC